MPDILLNLIMFTLGLGAGCVATLFIQQAFKTSAKPSVVARIFGAKPEPVKKESRFEPLRRPVGRWQAKKRELEQAHNSKQKERDSLYAKTR